MSRLIAKMTTIGVWYSVWKIAGEKLTKCGMPLTKFLNLALYLLGQGEIKEEDLISNYLKMEKYDQEHGAPETPNNQTGRKEII